MLIQASGARSTSGEVLFADLSPNLHLGEMRDALFHVDVTASTTGTIGDQLNLYFQSAAEGSTDWHDFAHLQVLSSAPVFSKALGWQRTMVASSDAVIAASSGDLAADSVRNGPVFPTWRLYWTVSATSAVFTYSASFEGNRFRA